MELAFSRWPVPERPSNLPGMAKGVSHPTKQPPANDIDRADLAPPWAAACLRTASGSPTTIRSRSVAPPRASGLTLSCSEDSSSIQNTVSPTASSAATSPSPTQRTDLVAGRQIGATVNATVASSFAVEGCSYDATPRPLRSLSARSTAAGPSAQPDPPESVIGCTAVARTTASRRRAPVRGEWS